MLEMCSVVHFRRCTVAPDKDGVMVFMVQLTFSPTSFPAIWASAQRLLSTPCTDSRLDVGLLQL